MKKLSKLEGAVSRKYNPFVHIIRTPSPSLNFTFGRTHGLPLGYTLCLYGPPKGGKSLISYAMAGQLHADDPDAIIVKFNTEMREEAQLTDEAASKVFNIDLSRYQGYDVNHPALVFDRIEKEIAAMCQDGAPIKMIVIDSLNGIQGRRTLDRESIMKQQIGDLALTLQEGLKQILPVQRKYKFALVLTTHVSAEMDQMEQKRTGSKFKMAAGFGVQHHAEYFMLVERNKWLSGGQSILGEKLNAAGVGDVRDKSDGERTGHKIRVKMVDSSMGAKERVGEFTMDYKRGIINTHEEVFLLGVNRGIIERPNNLSYVYGDKKWSGKPAMVQALIEDPDLQKSIIAELKRRDLAGVLGDPVENPEEFESKEEPSSDEGQS
jgi:RecA/RadA recombinase